MDADFPPEMLPNIEKFFREVHPTLKPGQDVYPEVFDTALFFPLQRQRELAKMMQIARKAGPPCSCVIPDPIGTAVVGKRMELCRSDCPKCKGTGTGGPRTVMEIGADKGGGLYHWCMSLPTVENVIACEIRGTPYEEQFEKAFPDIQFTFFPGSSRDAYYLRWLRDSKLSIDCLFIDGDKATTEKDFDAYRPMMSKGGVVFVHDVQDDHPGQAFNRIMGRGLYRTEVILDKSESFEALEREKAGEKVRTAWDGWLKQWAGRSCGVGVIYL